jgi:hypothetical protein
VNCIICGGKMTYYFRKYFTEFRLMDVDYFKCENCGFVGSKTHFEMPIKQWQNLNFEAHSYYNKIKTDPNNQPPPYLQQAVMLQVMRDHNFFSSEKWLDWGSGEAKLAKILDKYFSQKLLSYDKYITPNINSVRFDEIENKRFDLVINSAVFEHATNRLIVEEINNYVSKNGSLAIHTLVREEIPKDPNWFYLLPVHSAFHTNRSMKILMAEWGYKCSTYCVPAKMWVLFRISPVNLEKKVREVNSSLGFEYLLFSKGFMDYWKL